MGNTVKPLSQKQPIRAGEIAQRIRAYTVLTEEDRISVFTPTSHGS